MPSPIDRTPPLLSELILRPASRRVFLSRAAAAGAALTVAGCAPGGDGTGTAERDTTAAQAGAPGQPGATFNPNSRADTALAAHHAESSQTPALQSAPVQPYRRYDPRLPPLGEGGVTRLHWRALEVPVTVGPNLTVAAWTFEGDVPGPIVHVRQGDTVEFTLTNEGSVPHSMDFHAAEIDPAVAFRSVPTGESVSFTFQPRHAGAFMYHCGTAPVLMHIGTGMYGAIIVSPREPLPPAQEFVLVQSEYYVAPGQGGARAFDFQKMMSTLPDYVVFNGRPDQYINEPIRVRRGERVRFYVVSAGPSHPCNFHVVGEQFETVYLGAPPSSAIHGVQTFAVPPGGGMVFELMADIEGEFPFVNHGFGHGQKGAIGYLVVEA